MSAFIYFSNKQKQLQCNTEGHHRARYYHICNYYVIKFLVISNIEQNIY